MSQRQITVDVREDIRHGREPFARIMQAVQRLRSNEDLVLIAPFEPVPLFSLLARQGFSHQARAIDSGDWEVLFSRRAEGVAAPPDTVASSQPPCLCTRTVDLDARGLEPPQPLVTIIETLETLPEDTRLRALTDRRPVHLYDHLEARGYVGETEEQSDGSFVTKIQRA